MKQPRVRINAFIAVFALIVSVTVLGCDPFMNDGITSPSEITKKGNFYLTERASNSVIMLDYDMKEIKRWSLNSIAADTSVQGITFDGQYLWLSFAGSIDKIMQVNAEADTLAVIRSIDAPPTKQGTIRGITYDGQALWAVNTGSVSHSTGPALYKLDLLTGSVLQTITLNTPEPRGLSFYNPIPDVYGRSGVKGIYYTDITKDKIFYYSLEKFILDSAFSSPKPPMGVYNIYPTGLTTDGKKFYLVNSSDGADHLYQLDYNGKELSRYDFPYQYPQSIVWSTYDVRAGGPPAISGISPAKGVKGTNFAVNIAGSGFKAGLTVSFGSNITVDSLTVISPNLLHMYLKIDSLAVIGYRDVTITNVNGTTGTATGAFEVTATPKIEYLFWVDQNYSRIYQVRISDSTTIGTWSTKSISAGSPQGIAYDGTDLWLTCSGTDKSIYKIALTEGDTNAAHGTGSTVFPMPKYSSTLRGLTYSNGFFWQAVSGGKIYRVDPATGAVLDSIITTSAEPRGLAFIGNTLYCVDNTNKTLTDYTLSTSTWKTTFTIPSPGGSQFPTGVSYDGSNFWIANSTTLNDFVLKMNTTGQVLSYIDIRRGLSYDPSVSGIIYLAK